VQVRKVCGTQLICGRWATYSILNRVSEKVKLEMNQSLKIGIIGDFDQSRLSQLKTDESVDHVSIELSIAIDAVWLPTKSLERQTVTSKLRDFHAIWAGPGDYENPDGVIKAIRFCREQQWPFIGT